jgi:uncharacterized protein
MVVRRPFLATQRVSVCTRSLACAGVGLERVLIQLRQRRQTNDSIVSGAASAVLLGLISFYKTVVGPLVGRNCRFVPSCSDYMKEALETLGPTKGTILGAWRLARCNPAGGSGYDPVTWPPVGFHAGD